RCHGEQEFELRCKLFDDGSEFRVHQRPLTFADLALHNRASVLLRGVPRWRFPTGVDDGLRAYRYELMNFSSSSVAVFPARLEDSQFRAFRPIRPAVARCIARRGRETGRSFQAADGSASAAS